MADPNPKNDSLRSFSASVDENGQNMGQDEPNDIANPASLQNQLARNPGGEAETARLASGRPNQDATDATEAELSKETVDKLRNG